jgi:ectoine hydroxylase-related dioxygenase (phytanoyl-CoA dioxygenase family)
MTSTTARRGTSAGWYSPEDCRLDDFRTIVEQHTDVADYPYARAVHAGVLIYGADLQDKAKEAEERRRIQAELARALSDGPGIVVFERAFEDTAEIDDASDVFTALIAGQRASGAVAGDHFAKPGANDRIWGALDKFAVRDPGVFARYYANDIIALVSQTWLGSGYQITSQVNVVNPGGTAQTAHRDYHLGFMSLEQSIAYPVLVHQLSPLMTLQGAVAHCDMPVETGPTMYLPHSQKYGPGYVAFHKPEFSDYFKDNFVQLPLAKGDAAFFNPAVFHGAGTNRSADVRRMANLLQVSSAFGRAMEIVDRTAMCEVLFPVLRELSLDKIGQGNVIAASAEGYAFPANLDRDQPADGLAPLTQAELMAKALAEMWDDATFIRELHAHADRRTAAPR